MLDLVNRKSIVSLIFHTNTSVNIAKSVYLLKLKTYFLWVFDHKLVIHFQKK